MKAPPWYIGIPMFVAACYAGVAALAYFDKPLSYDTIAKQEAAECVRKKGGGGWRGSMGVSLEKFCEAYGLVEMHKIRRKDHPELY